MNLQKPDLPRSGQVPLHELTSFIGNVRDLLGSPQTIEHRLVAYQDKEGRWIVYAAGLYVGYPLAPNRPQMIRLGLLSLVSHRGGPVDAETPEKFVEFLHAWPSVAGPGDVRREGFSQNVNVDRVGSDQGYLGYPCWRASLYYATSSSDSPPPEGPFFDEESGRFAERAADAAVDWLEDDIYSGGSSPNSALRLAIADPRALMTRFTRDEESVRVTIVGTRPDLKLNVVVQTVGYGNLREPPISVPVVSDGGARAATIPITAPFQQFRALLFGPAGKVYDEVNESIARPSARGYELFGISPSNQDIGLAHALTTGESDTVECKEWMPTDVVDGKAIELLKAVCAFANGRGGSIYIGVSEQLEVKGTDRQLRVWRPKDQRGGQKIEDLRSEYAKVLRRRLADGLSPSVAVEIDWIEYGGGEYVCRVKVNGSGQLIHSIIATNDTYVRRGANNRKARPEEFADNASRKRITPELEPF